MSTFFHSLFCLYLLTVPIILEGTVYVKLSSSHFYVYYSVHQFPLYFFPCQLSLTKSRDDTQLYLPLKPNDRRNLNSLLDCLENIECWMAQNVLQLNENKSEVILFGPPDSIKLTTSSLGNLSTLIKPQFKNLDVIFDSAFKFDKQVNAVVKASFYQLRTLAKIKSFLSPKDLEKVIHAFISSRLDYCSSLYTGISHSSMSRLQLVQNAAARLLTTLALSWPLSTGFQCGSGLILRCSYLFLKPLMGRPLLISQTS